MTLSNYLKILNHKCIERFQDDSYGFSKPESTEGKGIEGVLKG